jgi:hypothetical protein
MRSGIVSSNLAKFLGAVMIAALVLAGLPALSASATGVDLYVAPTGSNAGPNNCLTESSPCLTVAYAITQAASGDAIHIAAGTYSENLNVGKTLTFIGAGMNQTILDGSSSGRVMYVNSSRTVSISDLTIQNGYLGSDNGAGIYNQGTLNLTRVKITSNTAVQGAGLATAGSFTIVDGVISNNNANVDATGRGGGIWIYESGSVSISNTTISGNTSTEYGGGIFVVGSSTVFSMINVTLSGNTSKNGGGMTATIGATVNVINSTITDNHLSSGSFGGGFSNFATISFKNSILANNDAPNCTNSGGSLTSLGYNLDSGNSCGFVNTGDLINTDPQLGVMGNNGGLTQTHALQVGSPAIDAGTNTDCPTTDQRGALRPYNSICDIGAYEYAEVTLSGNAGVGNAQINYGEYSLTDANAGGNYSFTVLSPWSGSVTPWADGYTFSPSHRDYSNVTTDLTDQDYTATATYQSVSTYDGHILESSASSGSGGTVNNTSPTFYLGDDAGNKQYRAILSFNTAGLPNNATITRAILKIRKQGLQGMDPFTILGGLRVDIRKSYFGTGLGLEAVDFKAAAHVANVSTFRVTPKNNWYFAVIGSAGFPYISLTGTTQFRLRFLTDSDNNNGADYMRFFSGDYSNAGARPMLVITYTLP